MRQLLNKALSRYERRFPAYGILPFLIALIFNMAVFFLTKVFTDSGAHVNLWLPLDDRIPFCTWMVIPYVASFPFWVATYLMAGRIGKDYYFKFITADLLGKSVCLLFFLLMPTTIVRPEFEVRNLGDWMLKAIYFFDSPTNLFPSLHCFMSWMCFRAVFRQKAIPVRYQVFAFVLNLLIFASTVMTKQHYIVDVPAGILLAEIALALAYHTPVSRLTAALFDKINKKVHLDRPEEPAGPEREKLE